MKRKYGSTVASSALALLFVCLNWTMRAQVAFALQSGDNIVFYGDEVTAVQFFGDASGPRIYTALVEAYALTRFPRLHLNFVNSGWNADRVSGGAGGSIDVRLQRDVLAYKPTVLTIMLGANDGWMTTFDPNRFEHYTSGYEQGNHPEFDIFDLQRFEAFTSGYGHLVEGIRSAAPGIHLTVIKPLVYEEKTQSPESANGRNTAIYRYRAWLDEIAQRDQLTIADPNAELATILPKAELTDAGIARKIMVDEMHPSSAGHLVIASSLLKAWHAPALVSAVEIDAHSRRIVYAKNTSVSEISRAGNLSWTQMGQSTTISPGPGRSCRGRRSALV